MLGIEVIIGNPPYNAWQKNENDNNKKRKYPIIDNVVRETYAKHSKATNKSALSDVYVKFFRWATDRLQGRDGIIAFISNNSFFTGIAFGGFRKVLAEEFTQIYHVDLGGNARKQESGNVFDIMVGVGITLAVRKASSARKTIYYYRVSDSLSKKDKLNFLKEKDSIKNIEWVDIYPSQDYLWINDGLHSEVLDFLPIGTKEIKETKASNLLDQNLDIPQAIFKMFSPGVQTNRDAWVYDFNYDSLSDKVKKMLDVYNAELDKWIRSGMPKDIDNFVIYDETKIKWSSRLKECFSRKVEAHFRPDAIQKAIYRPFVRKYIYFDNLVIHRPGLSPLFFPTPLNENQVICVPGIGDRKGFGCFVTSMFPDLELAMEKIQCFPFYIYSKDGSQRKENITDWALKQFQANTASLLPSEIYSTTSMACCIIHSIASVMPRILNVICLISL